MVEMPSSSNKKESYANNAKRLPTYQHHIGSNL